MGAIDQIATELACRRAAARPRAQQRSGGRGWRAVVTAAGLLSLSTAQRLPCQALPTPPAATVPGGTSRADSRVGGSSATLAPPSDTVAGGRRVTTIADLPLYQFPSDDAPILERLRLGTAISFASGPDTPAHVLRDSATVVVLVPAPLTTSHGEFIIPAGSILSIITESDDSLRARYETHDSGFVGTLSWEFVDTPIRSPERWDRVITGAGATGYIRE